jgi:hypothetical protein
LTPLIKWIEMDKKEITANLIQIYTKCIDECKKAASIYEMCFICSKHGCDRGVCHTSIKILNERIGETDWVKRHLLPSGYWACPPDETNSMDELISSLFFRLTILKMENVIP